MPRAGLSPTVVVAQAGELADRDGLDALTLATLADRLGVKVPSLYKHVTGLPDLRRRLRLSGLVDLDEALRAAAMGRAGPDALHAVAHAYRCYARTHPGRYAASQAGAEASDDAAVTAAATRLTDLMLAVMRGYGIVSDDALPAVRAVRAALHGFLAFENGHGFGLPHDVDSSFDYLVTLLDAGLQHQHPPHP